MQFNRQIAGGIVAIAALACPTENHATTLIYQPVDPAFGGLPQNGNVLLDVANAQNKYKDPSTLNLGASSYLNQTPLQQFQTQLQQAILSRVASSVTGSIVGPNGQLVPGTIDTGNFSINITKAGNGVLNIVTTDKTTGATTSFQVSQ